MDLRGVEAGADGSDEYAICMYVESECSMSSLLQVRNVPDAAKLTGYR
jgi:hypothetical protein